MTPKQEIEGAPMAQEGWQDSVNLLLEPVRPDAEGEDDLERADLQRLNEAVVAATDWTSETIIRQLDRGNINLNPAFQRRDAWTPSRKSKFIESLILGLPIPQLVLAESKSQKGSYVIIDGKQRLLSLRQFAAKSNDALYTPLKLQGLEIRKDLEDKTLESLENDPSLVDDLRAFQNQTIRTVVIKNWPNESVLYLIFLRLNTGSVPLSPQELRQALHPGPFLTFVDEQSGQIKGLQKVLNLSKPDFRMRDAELLVRYLGFRNFIPDYRGNLKLFLDDTCATLNKGWARQQVKLENQVTEMQRAFDTTFQIFGDDKAFRKWDGNKYEGRFNRAVFDIMMFYFSDALLSKRALSAQKGVENDFRRLCDSNPEFRTSLETTTKSLEATATRLMVWGDALAKRLKSRLAIPRLQNGHIHL
jgi:hypothetical protein